MPRPRGATRPRAGGAGDAAMSEPVFLVPDWPAPSTVRALVTTREGGVSAGGYGSLNLADHVGDDAAAVAENRRRLRVAAMLPQEPAWLSQVHGTGVLPAGAVTAGACADASFTDAAGTVCAVLTADCLPVLLCDENGRWVAALHAGWRGLAAGVIESTLACWGARAAETLAWLGPAIGPQAFEVGAEVRDVFVAQDRGADAAFVPSRLGHWHADLYQLARRRLAACGVRRVWGGHWCTYHESERFYSYRRDGATGRMASLIWRTD